MKQPTRMWKTLTFLMIAMTGTAMLLSWIDPSELVAERASVPADVSRYVQSVVSQRIKVVPERWQEIEIASAAASPFVGSLLAAPTGIAQHHFYIETDGQLTRTSVWESQRYAPRAPRVVRVAVVRRRGNTGMSSQQLISVRELLETLQSQIRGGRRTLPVRLGPHWQHVYDIADSAATEPTDSRLSASAFAST